ncbi:MAG TPA: Gfo/Idh/MocA family oxidoreductase [Chitinophagaceae bacterium]|jgi:UDP-N-acetyl-2-amino-2-deoxyglucuronate dehydrogenase|nr:Gfo/Idh/MocA family oxidoreductase [Chitinophagaceae bacterium]
MKNFVLIGAAGYIAPKHFKAIKETGNNLLAALDKHDSVGVLDSYFPEAHFFTEFERFDRHLEKFKRNGIAIDYVTVCSPNYLHDAHIRFGLRIGADVICEKPLVLNPWNVDGLAEMEKETGKKVYNILQLRLHPAIIAMKEQVEAAPDTYHQVDLRYITARGNWYHYSWKGEHEKSGGILSNIGIHFFDILTWIFGKNKSLKVDQLDAVTGSGSIEFENAAVNWTLSIDEKLLPAQVHQQGRRSFRSLVMNDKAIDFSSGFDDLHTRSYEEILKGNRCQLTEIKEVIELIHSIRHSKK